MKYYTELEKKWFKYAYSKYPFLTWTVDYDEETRDLIFRCFNPNLRTGGYSFIIMYNYIGESMINACPKVCDHHVRQSLTRHVKMIKEQCIKDLNESFKTWNNAGKI